MKKSIRYVAFFLAIVMCMITLVGCDTDVKDDTVAITSSVKDNRHTFDESKCITNNVIGNLNQMNVDANDSDDIDRYYVGNVSDLSVNTNSTESQQVSNIPLKLDETTIDSREIQSHSDILDKVSVKPTGDYREGMLLVKAENFDEKMLGSLSYSEVVPLYPNSTWYEVVLNENIDTTDAVEYLTSLDTLEKIDYDYIMASDGEVEEVDISGNVYEPDPDYFESMNVREAWKSLKEEGYNPGGSSDVIVAIIDTGVDYNHLDLNDNIWMNSGEIPNNGIDDDGNGYVDDVYGWNFVGNNNNPMDDNGHGTHCAGIVAAENNDIGTVGIAYNCKIMCLKAGTSSGSFNNSDIAEAIRYAYMNGASVINMSFGGPNISLVVEEALVDAYYQCVLVAAAGNKGLCNEPGCSAHEPLVEPFYPAALSYVVGVMSCNSAGTNLSPFSNFDHYLYNKNEYDVNAPGENISSTFPNNKYAKLSGTSMSAPQVSAIAALTRTKYHDREMYSNKFITAQVVRGGGEYICTDAYLALQKISSPFIYSLYDYYFFDNVEFDYEHNNGNGIIEAGETIHLGLELMNRGGKASNVTVTANTHRLDEDINDPYIHFISDSVHYSDIGIYSISDAGKIYDDSGHVIDMENSIIIKIDDDTPNDYFSIINIVCTYENGVDPDDDNLYSAQCSVSLSVTNGFVLPYVISEDTVFKANRQYIVAHDVTIPYGVHVVFEEGTSIQFYSSNNGYYDLISESPVIHVYGELEFLGSKDRMINIYPSDLYYFYACRIESPNNSGKIRFKYCELVNEFSYNGYYSSENDEGNIEYDYCHLNFYSDNPEARFIYSLNTNLVTHTISGQNISNCRINLKQTAALVINFKHIDSNVFIFGNTGGEVYARGTTVNNTFVYEDDASGMLFHFYAGAVFNNNVIVSAMSDANSLSFGKFESTGFFDSPIGNVFEGISLDYLPLYFRPYINSLGRPVLENDIDNHSEISAWPYIKDIMLFDEMGNLVKRVGSETIRIVLQFNKPMNTEEKIVLYYGSAMPYREFSVDGDFSEDGMSWQGSFKVLSYMEGGLNYFSVVGGCAMDDSFKTLINNAPSFAFTIDNTIALSMNLQAVADDNDIVLSWIQDDYDTLMGYNVYRSEEKDGNYVKLNSYVIPSSENTFIDEDAEPGKTYWYTFTVVLSDMSESAPAGKISCTAKDTIAPNAYHTPVNQGYLNNNLVISCTASDNIAVSEVKLYYRTIGETEWKSIVMMKQNDRFSATIFGSELSMEGLEYYITVSDGVITINKGSVDSPYHVIVKDASAIASLGDVDGDGTITTKDALMIIQAINGDILLTDDQFRRANLNGDDILSSVEALRILQYINGNVKSLEM